MRASECKLGDRILLHLNENGGITTTRTHSVSTIIATVIRAERSDMLGVLVGWKEGEPFPADARDPSTFMSPYNAQAVIGYHKASIIHEQTTVDLVQVSTSVHTPTPAPVQTPTPEPVLPVFDWDKYNGFTR